MRLQCIDLKKKIQLCAWHPKENTFAVARHNLLFIYSERRSAAARIASQESGVSSSSESEMMGLDSKPSGGWEM